MSTISSIGVPREIKPSEGRVSVTPDGVRELERAGVRVLVEKDAGAAASIPDSDYVAAGAEIVDSPADAWAADLVVKVKEPQESEFRFLRDDLVLFTYLHLAAYPKVADALLAARTTAFAYETVRMPDGSLPLLAPMSEIAGRLSPQMGARFLEAPQGGRGILLGGAPGVAPARVVVVGAGNVGWNAARVAAGMGAEVTVLDQNPARLRELDQIKRDNTVLLSSNKGVLERVVAAADLVVGAVLVPGGRAPVVVTEEMVRTMRPGSVIVDVAIDQGGCVETSTETTHHDPVVSRHGVLHYAVGNMPGAVPHTSTHALTNATIAHVTDLARLGVRAAVGQRPALAHGLNTLAGQIVDPTVATALGVDSADPIDLLPA